MKKLLKYEFRNSKKDFLQLILILMGGTTFLQLFFFTMVTINFNGRINMESSPLFAFVILFPFIVSVLFFVCMIAYYLKLAGILQNDLYEDQAYFTFSLPYNGYQFMGAKYLIGIMWAFIMPILLAAWNIILFILNATNMLRLEQKQSFTMAFNELMKIIGTGFSRIAMFLNRVGYTHLILNIISYILGIILFVAVVYLAVIVNYRLGKRKRNITWILYVFIFMLLYSFFNNLIGINVATDISSEGIGLVASIRNVSVISLIIHNIIETALIGIIYFYTSHVMDKKIEI